MILDGQHAFASASTSSFDREPRRSAGGQGTPLAEFAWSDATVGMGFLPHGLALPAGWRWERPR